MSDLALQVRVKHLRRESGRSKTRERPKSAFYLFGRADHHYATFPYGSAEPDLAPVHSTSESAGKLRHTISSGGTAWMKALNAFSWLCLRPCVKP